MFVVAGISGNTGKVVAETLLAQGKPLRVIVRDVAKGEAWRRRGAEVAVADLDDAAALTGALGGAQGAYLLLPPAFGSTQVRRDNAQRIQGYVKAIEASGVGHVVLLSSVGAHLEQGTGPVLSAHDAEAALGQLRVATTFVRAAYFMENWGASLYALAAGTLPSFIKDGLSIPMVATQDIGTTCAKALVEGGQGHSVIELAGPREYTPSEVAEALARIIGKPIQLQEAPEAAIVPALTGAGLNPHWAELYKELYVALNTGRLVQQGGRNRFLRGTTEIEVVLKRLISGS